jgi:hypothetical protein
MVRGAGPWFEVVWLTTALTGAGNGSPLRCVYARNAGLEDMHFIPRGINGLEDRNGTPAYTH